MEILIPIFAAIIGGLVTLFTNQQNREQNEEINQQNVDLAKETREDQQQYSTEAAQAANEETRRQYWELYSPQAKVKQLKDAGLSVGLMYGGGGAGGGGGTAAQAATPAAAAPVMQPYMMSGMAEALMNALQTGSNVTKQGKEAEKTDEETAAIRQNIAESNARIEEIKSRINSSEYQNKLTVMQTSLTKQQTEYAELQTKFDKETYSERAKQYKLLNDKTEREIEGMLETISGMKIDNQTKGELNQAIIDNYKAQQLQAMESIEVMKMEKAQKEIQNKILQAQSEREKERLQKELEGMDETINLTKEYIKTEQEKQKTEQQKRENMSVSSALMSLRMANYQAELFLGRAEKIAGAAGVIF